MRAWFEERGCELLARYVEHDPIDSYFGPAGARAG
jgi:hypothetical protein